MSEAAKKINDQTLTQLIALVKEHTGITMEERKREMLFSRLRPRLRILGLENAEQYIEHLQDSSKEAQEFVNLVTTNETVFFRTPMIWDYFKNEFLPDWRGQHPENILRIWSAAASSGEEAVSLAISCEEFKLKFPSFRYQIHGSDISTEVLDKARSGVFKEKSVSEFKAKHSELFEKYFRELPTGEAKVLDGLLQNMTFAVHNLHRLPPKSEFYDIVFLRNVLIYFNDLDQELVLAHIHRSLKPGGILVLGESESLARLKTAFHFKKPLIYTKER